MIDSISGIPWLPANILTFFRQYMIRSPNTAEGSTLPRYCMYFGVGFPAGKIIKGIKRVSIVPKTTMPTVIICCVSVIL